VPGLNPRFLYPKSKIFCANTYTSSVDIILWNFIKSFPNFETVFDKISRKKNYSKKKKLIKIFQMLPDVNTCNVTDDWNNYLNIFNKPLKILVKQPPNMFIIFGVVWRSSINKQSPFITSKTKRQINVRSEVRTYSRVWYWYAHTKFEPFHKVWKLSSLGFFSYSHCSSGLLNTPEIQCSNNNESLSVSFPFPISSLSHPPCYFFHKNSRNSRDRTLGCTFSINRICCECSLLSFSVTS
jgi:hypothetical protein